MPGNTVNKTYTAGLNQTLKRRTKINITNYQSLLTAAKQQEQPQRLLFVFLKATLPKDHEGDEESRFNQGKGGQLEPIMCVDKALEELGSFAELVAESKKMEQDWKIVLVAALSGTNGIAPTAQDADQPLKTMVQTIEHGGDLANYLAFDRDGEYVRFT